MYPELFSWPVSRINPVASERSAAIAKYFWRVVKDVPFSDVLWFFLQYPVSKAQSSPAVTYLSSYLSYLRRTYTEGQYVYEQVMSYYELQQNPSLLKDPVYQSLIALAEKWRIPVRSVLSTADRYDRVLVMYYTGYDGKHVLMWDHRFFKGFSFADGVRMYWDTLQGYLFMHGVDMSHSPVFREDATPIMFYPLFQDIGVSPVLLWEHFLGQYRHTRTRKSFRDVYAPFLRVAGHISLEGTWYLLEPKLSGYSDYALVVRGNFTKRDLYYLSRDYSVRQLFSASSVSCPASYTYACAYLPWFVMAVGAWPVRVKPLPVRYAGFVVQKGVPLSLDDLHVLLTEWILIALSFGRPFAPSLKFVRQWYPDLLEDYVSEHGLFHVVRSHATGLRDVYARRVH